MAGISNKQRVINIVKEMQKTRSKKKRDSLRTELFNKLYRLSCWVCKHYTIDGYMESEDLCQDGALTLLECIDKFVEDRINPEMIVKYAFTAVRNEMQRVEVNRRTILSGDTYNNNFRFKAHYRHFCRVNQDIYGYEDFLSMDNDATHVLPAYTYNREVYDEEMVKQEPFDVNLTFNGNHVISDRIYFELFFKSCGCSEREAIMAVDYVCNDKNLEDIALMHDISRERVRQLIQRALSKARKDIITLEENIFRKRIQFIREYGDPF